MRTPLLQIIHISDLHVCHDYSDKAFLARENLRARLLLRAFIARRNLLGWHEGTLDYDETAGTAFKRFLEKLKEGSPQWFGAAGSETSPQTWLVDSGDASTFGDEPSIQRARALLKSWRAALGDCPVRLLFGNHDAWPGTQPGLLIGADFARRIELQKNLLAEWKEWREEGWVPMTVRTPNSLARIELYAVNSVIFSAIDNALALGSIPDEKLAGLISCIEDSHRRDKSPVYRILMVHHPVAFPYSSGESRTLLILKQMMLTNADRVIERLRNDASQEPHLRPYVHLILSGHTHLAFPGARLPATVKETYQGQIGVGKQMQLVAGPLMLVRDRERVRKQTGPHVRLRDRTDFSQPYVFDANQQFQILRFYVDSELENGLTLERFVLARLPTEGDYHALPELRSKTSVFF